LAISSRVTPSLLTGGPPTLEIQYQYHDIQSTRAILTMDHKESFPSVRVQDGRL